MRQFTIFDMLLLLRHAAAISHDCESTNNRRPPDSCCHFRRLYAFTLLLDAADVDADKFSFIAVVDEPMFQHICLRESYEHASSRWLSTTGAAYGVHYADFHAFFFHYSERAYTLYAYAATLPLRACAPYASPLLMPPTRCR